MPLSEDEERILQDIERSFYENDPGFARTVDNADFTKSASRNCRLAIGGFVIGLAVLVLTFTRVPIVGFLGFLVMLGSAVVFVQNLRRLAAAGMQEIVEAQHKRQAPGSFDFKEKFNRRFRHDL